MKASAKSVQDALDAAGLEATVVEMPASTRSAQEAADAIGCTVAQIAKSLVFQTKTSAEPIMVIAAGNNRVDTKLVAARVGQKLRQASPDFVREATGFAIGGVPPVGHPSPIRTFIDEELFSHDEIWAAAGTPNAVFKLRAADLVKLSAGEVMALKVD